MKTKITKYLMIMSSFLLIWSALCLWYDKSDFAFPRWETQQKNCPNGQTKLWDCIDISENENSIIKRLLIQFWLTTEATSWNHKFINYARAILNLALWLLSMIALVMTIYTFYMMFFSDNEEWIKKAKWNLIGIFIALAIIGVSRLIVSLIFRWYQSNWKAKEQEISTWNISMVTEKISNNDFYLNS